MVTLRLVISGDSRSAVEAEIDAIAEVGLPGIGPAGSDESDAGTRISWSWEDDLNDTLEVSVDGRP